MEAGSRPAPRGRPEAAQGAPSSRASSGRRSGRRGARQRAHSVPSSGCSSRCSSLGPSEAGSGAATPTGGDHGPRGGPEWQRAMMAALAKSDGSQGDQRAHVPAGFRVRNTFLEFMEDSGSSDSGGEESNAGSCAANNERDGDNRGQVSIEQAVSTAQSCAARSSGSRETHGRGLPLPGHMSPMNIPQRSLMDPSMGLPPGRSMSPMQVPQRDTSPMSMLQGPPQLHQQGQVAYAQEPPRYSLLQQQQQQPMPASLEQGLLQSLQAGLQTGLQPGLLPGLQAQPQSQEATLQQLQQAQQVQQTSPQQAQPATHAQQAQQLHQQQSRQQHPQQQMPMLSQEQQQARGQPTVAQEFSQRPLQQRGQLILAEEKSRQQPQRFQQQSRGLSLANLLPHEQSFRGQPMIGQEQGLRMLPVLTQEQPARNMLPQEQALRLIQEQQAAQALAQLLPQVLQQMTPEQRMQYSLELQRQQQALEMFEQRDLCFQPVERAEFAQGQTHPAAPVFNSSNSCGSAGAIPSLINRDYSEDCMEWQLIMKDVNSDIQNEAAKRVRPPKPRRLRGKQLAESLFRAQHGTRQDRAQAAQMFLHATTGDEGLHTYACMVLRRMNEEASVKLANGEDPMNVSVNV